MTKLKPKWLYQSYLLMVKFLARWDSYFTFPQIAGSFRERHLLRSFPCEETVGKLMVSFVRSIWGALFVYKCAGWLKGGGREGNAHFSLGMFPSLPAKEQHSLSARVPSSGWHYSDRVFFPAWYVFTLGGSVEMTRIAFFGHLEHEADFWDSKPIVEGWWPS